MKKAIFLLLIAFIFAGAAFAANFSPKILRVSAPPAIKYNFDNKALEVPITVSGTNAGLIFCVYTKGKGSAIGKLQNGYLGWHYVNSIDTAMYISPFYNMDVGSNKLIWDGKGKTGSLVPAADYTYYIWAYDNRNPKQYVSRYMTSVMHNLGSQIHIQETDNKGLPLAKPYALMLHAFNGNHAKWAIGSDPDDSSFVETTKLSGSVANWSFDRRLSPLQTDQSYFFASGGLSTTVGNAKGVWKFKWVPNGAATIDVNWGTNGYAGITRPYDAYAGPVSDLNNVYWCNNAYHFTDPESDFYAWDLADGSQTQHINMSDWWCRPDDAKAGGFINGGPNGMSIRNGMIVLGSHAACLNQLVNPNADKASNFVVFANQNGDYIFDHNFAPTAALKWVCMDFKVPPFTTSFEADANFFVAGAVYDNGAVSFGLEGPDGTGITNVAFAGETAARKFYVNFVDYGSPFDGMYTDNQGSVGKTVADPNNAILVPGFMFVGHDSIKGTIGTQTGVEEAAPQAFSVSQNTPNPFNPSTTINFSMVKAGKVTVEIFNVAGQKIETLVNSTMNSGVHSVVWNASKYSGGVYFYTVKSGNEVRTMKMTLIK